MEWFAPVCTRHGIYKVWSSFGVVGWRCSECSRELFDTITTDRSNV
jgi:hypothetical protein